MTNDKFPIRLGDEIKTVPWDMLLEHKVQVVANHGLPLGCIANDGGLTPDEACAIMEDRPFEYMETTAAVLALKQHVEQWLAKDRAGERPTHLFILTKSAETRRRLENIRDGRLMLSRGHMNEAISLLEELEHIVRGEA